MALHFTGGLLTGILKPVFVNPCFAIPGVLNLQVRYAARKGYRDAKKKKKRDAPKVEINTKEMFQVKKKFSKIERTVEEAKPDLPDDDVYIENLFKLKKYSLIEAINFHKEYHHPSVFNNVDAPILVRIEFNMVAKKKTQFLKPFRGLANMPHPFNLGLKRDVLVFCGPEYVESAKQKGATIAGGLDVVAKVKEGVVIPSLFEYVLCHTKFFPELTPIRNILKTQLPKPRLGTLTTNLEDAIPRFLHGIQYTCIKVETAPDFGLVDCQIGTVDMEAEKIEENLKSLLDELNKNKPDREGDFITYVACRSPPSTSQFVIDFSKYIDSTEKELDDDDNADEESEGKQSEMSEIRTFLKNAEQEEMENQLLR
ncbi:hypothetical protein RUM43_003352 [Polyplax serrata]|uniref:Uncharacterized protein n=1 Tax=Polyplax serrata TaxID=468196 RepID=A0AAN8NWJ7_POLSC